MSFPELSRRRYRSHRVEAVVLRHSNWGETDRLVWLYTLEMGKLCAIAKGVRKPRSRKAGHLEPFTQVSLLLAQGRDLPIITQADTIEAFLPLREDLLRTTYAAYVVELIDRFTFQDGELRNLYQLLVVTLKRLCQPSNQEIALRTFEMRLLDEVGFRPQLFQCVVCAEEIQAQDQFLSAQLGGVVCPKCRSKAPECQPISLLALKYLRHFQRSSFKEALRAKLTPTLRRETEDLIHYYLTYLLERSLNTPPFIERMRRVSQERREKSGDEDEKS